MDLSSRYWDPACIKTDSDLSPRKLDIRDVRANEACDQISRACRELKPGESLHVIGPVPPVYVNETLEYWEGLELHMLTTNSPPNHLLISMDK